MELEIEYLVVEVTRRCNMKCRHCLRGEPQNKTMSKQHIFDFLSQTKYISNVTFTGGEPTLPSGMKVIEDFIDVTIGRDIDIGNFYMVTNAKVWRPELPYLVNRLYNICSDNEISLIDISTDSYHDHITEQRHKFKRRLEEDLFYEYGLQDLVGMRRDIYESAILPEGRGTQYGNPAKEAPEFVFDMRESYSCLNISEAEFYLNCDGNVISGCDWSYESQKDPKNIICAASDDMKKILYKMAEAEIEMET